MKKLICILGALSVILSAGCSTKSSDNSGNNGSSGIVGDQLSTRQTAYRQLSCSLDHGYDESYLMGTDDSGNIHLFSRGGNDLLHAVMSATDESIELISDTVVREDYGMGFSVCLKNDGGFYVLSTKTDFAFTYAEGGYIDNYADFIDNGRVTFVLTEYDSGGNIVAENDVIGLERDFQLNGSIMNDLVPYGEGRLLFSFGNGLALMTTDGDLLDSAHYEFHSIDLGVDSRGRVIESNIKGWGYMDGETLSLPDRDEAPEENTLDLSGHALTGSGDFSAYINRGSGMYGINENGEEELVADYGKCGVSSTDMNASAAVGDNKFVGAAYFGHTVTLLVRRPDDYVDERPIIDLWVLGGPAAEGDQYTAFNRAQDKFVLKTKGIMQNPEELARTLLVEDGPDLVEYSGYSVMNKLVNFGAVADMYELMDKYGGVTVDDLMPNVVKSLDMKGKLYGLPTNFGIELMYAASDYIGKEYSGWSFDDLYRFYNDRPEGMRLFSDTDFPSSVPVPMKRFIVDNIDPWIDRENAVCHFDSPEFVKLLKFCKETNDSRFRSPWDVMDDPIAQEELYKETSTALKEHRSMMKIFAMGSAGLGVFVYDIGADGLTYDEVTLLNPPGNGGKGYTKAGKLTSVMSNSDCPEGAWAFVSYILSYEWQGSEAKRGGSGWNFTNKRAFEESMERMVCEDGEPEIGRLQTPLSGEDSIISYPIQVTRAQMENFKSFVMNCEQVSYENSAIESIIQDEYYSYLNDEITAEQCAEFIQNRAAIMLSEKS